MAAIRASGDVVLLTNGKTAAVINLRFPAEIQVLELPNTGNDTRVTPHAKSTKKQKNALKQQEKSIDDDSQGKQEHATEQGIGKDTEDRAETENQVLACALSLDGQLVALCDDRKSLHVYQAHRGRYRLIFSSLVAHRCTSVTLTRNNEHVVVADKSGDAYVFHVQEQDRSHGSRAVHESSTEELVHKAQSASLSGDNTEGSPGGGSLLLGHHSMLLDVMVVDSDSLVVTCDRDEKIRVSHYPDAYNIQAYCLGHTKFVVSLAYDESRKLLMSGSGDGTVRLWTTDGQELHRRNVLSDIPTAHLATESTAAEKNIGAPQLLEDESGRQKPQISVQQISFSSECQTLFVSLYKSPHVLVYKLSGDKTDGLLALQFSSVLGEGQEDVASLCVSRNVLWVLRQGGSRLNVSAYKIECENGTVQLLQVTEQDGSVFVALKTFCDQADLLSVTTNTFDLIPCLWKPPFQGDASLKPSPKRPAVGKSNRHAKRHKRKGDC